tara:strand:+ start:2303 stop:2635 length:333 start_codon:yes stop_codon:yes gene_type:complete
MDYNFIIDPKTNKTHSIFSKYGRNLLKSFLKEYMTGGVGNKDYTPEQGNVNNSNNNNVNTQVDERARLNRLAETSNTNETMIGRNVRNPVRDPERRSRLLDDSYWLGSRQ